MLRSLSFFILIMAAMQAMAQPKTDPKATAKPPAKGTARYEQLYRDGMALYDKGQYTEAAKKLILAQIDAPENVFAAQARFMTGSAYLKVNQPENAIAALASLQNKYPDWNGRDRTSLALMEAHFKAKHWRKGAQQLIHVRGKDQIDEAQAAAYAGLANCPADTLLFLEKAFQQTQPIEARLAEAGKAPNADGEVKARARQLAESGRITYLKLTGESKKAFEGAIDVAIFLPMNANPASPGDNRNALAELVAGAQLAAEDLARQGNPVNLHIYDTHKNADSLSRLLTLPELKQCRLIIGPVLQGVAEAAEYASFNGIAMVAPLTNQIRWQEGNTAAYLAEPSIDGIVKAVFAQVPGITKAGVIYGTTASDSMLAHAFLKEAEKAGVPAPLFKRVAKNSASNLGKFILESGLDSLSLLFVPDRESLVRVQLAQALEVSQTKARVVTYGELLEDTEVPFATFERLGVRFLYPNHIPNKPREDNSVAERLTSRLGLPPTDAAFKGYDLVYTLAPLMRADKPADALRLNSPIKGQFGLGYDFATGPANAEVPIYRVERGTLVRE